MLPTKNLQVQVFGLITKSDSVNTMSAGALGFSPFRPVTTPLCPLPGIAVPGQFQLRSRDPGLPSVGLNLRLWWLTGSREASSLYSLELSLENSVVFTSPLVNRLCSRSWNYRSRHSPHYTGPHTGGNWTPDLSGEKSALYHWAILTTLHSCVYTRITTLLIIVIHKVGTFEWTRPGTWTLPKNIWYGVLTLTVHVIRGIFPSQFTSP